MKNFSVNIFVFGMCMLSLTATTLKRRSIKSKKCKYTFVVNELDTTSCPSSLPNIQADTDSPLDLSAIIGDRSGEDLTIPKSLSGQANKDILVRWLNDMEKEIVKEKEKNLVLNSTLSKHENALQKAEQAIREYQSNFSQVFRMLRFLEQRVVTQHEVSRNLDNKLSSIMLDVVEVNNVLSKKVPTTGGSVHDKEIQVQSVTKQTACGVSADAEPFRDCADVFSKHKTSGVYYVVPTYAACPIPVWCDMDTPGGGWMVLLRRKSGKVNFNQNWESYKHGFGNIASEYWLGNDNIFLFTNQDFYELRVDLWDFDGNRVYALYKSFKIDGERDKYRLHIHSFEGSAKDSFIKHNKMMFSTPDRDHDTWTDYNCAKEWEAGWWFTNCWFAFLTGTYYNTSTVRYRGISWNQWKHEQLPRVEMKIRPHFNQTTSANKTPVSVTALKP